MNCCINGCCETLSGKPWNEIIQLVINSGSVGKASLILYDLNGKKIKEITQSLTTGKNQVVLNAAELNSGTYFLETEFSGARKVNKIVVLN